ncbi:SDR family NAD(P)-dependent oxidoreductase [Motilimonas pumila]|uniref:SDR family oxidoreductase n=1 Tax=Motilimonas pumila TaxID=2303987 RepID=A0A418YII7_9GAMM|nr:SDR family oxidoreductase [Motilimonas pumila]RJG50432.1 SDR family oxidoreductase [Motilimonas pumila]
MQLHALITGASKGIGAALAQQFAQQGYFVHLNTRSNSVAAQALLDTIKQQGGQGKLAIFDVTRAEECQDYLNDLSQLDVLVNNAGMLKDNLLPQVSAQDWQAVLDVNYRSPQRFMNQCLPLLEQAGAPCVINLASISGVKPRPGQAAYAVSKAMLIRWTQQLAAQYPKIKSYAISPGPVATEMITQAPWYQLPNAFDRIPLKRFAKPSEIASAAHFLAQHQMLPSGHNLIIDGGFTQTIKGQ